MVIVIIALFKNLKPSGGENQKKKRYILIINYFDLVSVYTCL